MWLASNASRGSELLGYALMIFASLLWSLSPAIISRFSKYIKPVTFTGLRALIASVTLFLVSLLSGGVEVSNLSTYVLVIAILSAVIGPGVGDVFYTKSIQLIGGFLAVVLGYTYMFVAQTIAVFFLGESMTAGLLIGSFLAFTGVVVAVHGGTTINQRRNRYWKGIAYALITSVSWGVSTSMLKIALGFTDELALTILRLTAISLIFLPAGVLHEGRPPNNSVKPFLLVAAVTATLDWTLGMYVFIYSINLVGVATTVVITALTPVLTTITSKTVAREKPSPTNIVGALLTSAGIAITTL